MKVSVVIPTFNDEGTIAETLESVFAQRFDGSFEVIVVIDGSTDGTRAVLEKFGGWIRVIEQPNRGVSAARNTGIRAATGEYIALLDGDDTWTEEMLQKTVPVLDKNPACAAVFADGMLVDLAGRITSPHYVEPGFDHSPTLDEMLAHAWPILVGAIVIRRETLLATGGFPEEYAVGYYGGEDVFAFILIRERGEIVYLPETLMRYRRPDFMQRVAKRVAALRRDGKSRDGVVDLEIYFGGHQIFKRLVRQQFGARGDMLVEDSIDRKARELVTLGMMAMHEGNRGLARRCYRSAIRSRPATMKTYFRLLWAVLPQRLARVLSPMLSSRLRQSVSGPPVLEQRPL
jgi:glycosyltransferase involved in cell wall biosynthesis